MNTDRKDWIVGAAEQILITGSNGFVGQKVLEILVEYGFRRIRCLVRSNRNLEKMRELGEANHVAIEFCRGNLLSREDCIRAAKGAAIVYHLAAGTGKSFAGCFADSAVATRNLLDACLNVRQFRRIVSVGSLAEYSGTGIRRGTLIDERSPIEADHMARFDPYCYGKVKQSELVSTYGRDRGLRYVIVRPGPVFGPGKAALTGRLGVQIAGLFVHVGGRNVLPLIFVDNCAEAIVVAGLAAGVDGEVFNAVDDELPRSTQFLRSYRMHVRRIRTMRVPYWVFYWASRLWERYSEYSSGQLPPVFNQRQSVAYFQPQRYSNRKLKERTGWRPRVGHAEAVDKYFDFMREIEGSY